MYLRDYDFQRTDINWELNLTGVKPESIALATGDKSTEDTCTCWIW
jgi:hypothetical protein